MSDLISRETAQVEINKYHLTSGVTHQGVWNECVDVVSHTIGELPSADITECARAIKEYCKNKDEDCTGCPFEAKNKNACELGRMMFPSEWFLPEEEKKSCITCKNSDDEFSGECYECVKGIFDHYEPEGEKGGSDDNT